MSEERDEREQWAETEARQFDKIADAIRKSAEQWRTMSPSAETMNMAQVCILKADTWEEAARSLRQSYQVRIERQERGQ